MASIDQIKGVHGEDPTHGQADAAEDGSASLRDRFILRVQLFQLFDRRLIQFQGIGDAKVVQSAVQENPSADAGKLARLMQSLRGKLLFTPDSGQ